MSTCHVVTAINCHVTLPEDTTQTLPCGFSYWGVKKGWQMPDFIFKGADKEQERGLEPVPGSGCSPEFMQKLRLSPPEPLRQPVSHMPEAPRSGGNGTGTWLLRGSVTSPRVVAVP